MRQAPKAPQRATSSFCTCRRCSECFIQVRDWPPTNPKLSPSVECAREVQFPSAFCFPISDAIGTEHVQEGCESPKYRVEKACIASPQMGPNKAKTVEIRPIRILHSTKLAGIFKSLGEGWKTAKLPNCRSMLPPRLLFRFLASARA
jgi:hypothetical protein